MKLPAGALLFVAVTAGIALAMQGVLLLLLIGIRYTLSILGLIKMVEFAVGVPLKVAELAESWYAVPAAAAAVGTAPPADAP